jgi:hypothetical protein
MLALTEMIRAAAASESAVRAIVGNFTEFGSWTMTPIMVTAAAASNGAAIEAIPPSCRPVGECLIATRIDSTSRAGRLSGSLWGRRRRWRWQMPLSLWVFPRRRRG